MASTKSGGTTRGRSTTTAKSRSTPSRATSSSSRSTSSGSFLAAVRERPIAAAAIAAGAAGASAFLWARRAQLTEQVNNLSEAISERWSGNDASEPTGADPASEFGSQKFSAPSSSGKKGRKASATDPMMEEQSAVGAISY
jgi:hypothetical protein